MLKYDYQARRWVTQSAGDSGGADPVENTGEALFPEPPKPKAKEPTPQKPTPQKPQEAQSPAEVAQGKHYDPDARAIKQNPALDLINANRAAKATGQPVADTNRQIAAQGLANAATQGAESAPLVTYQDVYAARTVAEKLGTAEAHQQWRDTSAQFLSAKNQLALEKEVAAKGATGPTAVTDVDVMQAANRAGLGGTSPDAAENLARVKNIYSSPENQRLLATPDIRGPGAGRSGDYNQSIEYAKTTGSPYNEGGQYNTRGAFSGPILTSQPAPLTSPTGSTTTTFSSGGVANAFDKSTPQGRDAIANAQATAKTTSNNFDRGMSPDLQTAFTGYKPPPQPKKDEY